MEQLGLHSAMLEARMLVTLPQRERKILTERLSLLTKGLERVIKKGKRTEKRKKTKR